MTNTLAISKLKPLYKDMKTQGVGRAKFAYTHGAVTFDVFFFIDENPFSLLFGVKKHNLAFELRVEQGFVVTCELPKETYKALCKALGLTYDPNNKFSVTAFLKDFEKFIPAAFDSRLSAEPHDIAVYRSDVEESAKIYFYGWRDNNLRGEQGSERNLHKTRRLLGETAYLVCKSKNLSSCWTDEKSKVIQVTSPR